MTVERLNGELQAAAARRRDGESTLMIERAQWKAERMALEEKLKKVRNFEKTARYNNRYKIDIYLSIYLLSLKYKNKLITSIRDNYFRKPIEFLYIV